MSRRGARTSCATVGRYENTKVRLGPPTTFAEFRISICDSVSRFSISICDSVSHFSIFDSLLCQLYEANYDVWPIGPQYSEVKWTKFNTLVIQANLMGGGPSNSPLYPEEALLGAYAWDVGVVFYPGSNVPEEFHEAQGDSESLFVNITLKDDAMALLQNDFWFWGSGAEVKMMEDQSPNNTSTPAVSALTPPVYPAACEVYEAWQQTFPLIPASMDVQDDRVLFSSSDNYHPDEINSFEDLENVRTIIYQQAATSFERSFTDIARKEGGYFFTNPQSQKLVYTKGNQQWELVTEADFHSLAQRLQG